MLRKILLINVLILVILFLFAFKTSPALAEFADCTISPSTILSSATSQQLTIASGIIHPLTPGQSVDVYFSNAPNGVTAVNECIKKHGDISNRYDGINCYYMDNSGRLGTADGDGSINLTQYPAIFSPKFDDYELTAGVPIYAHVYPHNADGQHPNDPKPASTIPLCNPNTDLKLTVNRDPNYDCTFTYSYNNPAGPNTKTQGIGIGISGGKLVSPDNKFRVTLSGDASPQQKPQIPRGGPFNPFQYIDITNKTLTTNWNFTENKYTIHRLKKGTLTVSVSDSKNKAICSDSVEVSGPPPNEEGLCSLNFDNGSNITNTFKPYDPIKFIANFPNADNPTHRVYIQPVNDNDIPYGGYKWDQCYSQSDLSDDNPSDTNPPGIDIYAALDSGRYYLQVNSQCAPMNESFACGQKFRIGEDDGGLDGNPADIPQIQNFVKTPCSDYQKDEKGNSIGCNSVFSGLGVFLPTDPLDLVPQILRVILGVAGGIVVILIIRAGYKLMFSQGNPEKVQEAKDELTSAIVGLLFIIFSFVLLQFITNDILNLESLKKGEGIKNP